MINLMFVVKCRAKSQRQCPSHICADNNNNNNEDYLYSAKEPNMSELYVSEYWLLEHLGGVDTPTTRAANDYDLVPLWRVLVHISA